MAPPSPRRRWPQFGLRSLILLTIACALVLTWWRQWRVESQLKRSARTQQEAKFNDERNRVYAKLDLENGKHRETFKCLRGMLPIFSTSERLLLWTGPNKYEIVTFRYDDGSIPGRQSTAVLLIEGDRLVDAVARTSYCGIWEEHHQAKLEDASGDGVLDLVIHEKFTGTDGASTVIYQITPEGFYEAGN
jgi:hypothetical protein